MADSKGMKQDVECWMTGVIDPQLVDVCEDNPARFIANEAVPRAEELLKQLAKDGIVPDAPGEFYIVVGYRSRPKGY